VVLDLIQWPAHFADRRFAKWLSDWSVDGSQDSALKAWAKQSPIVGRRFRPSDEMSRIISINVY